MSKPTLSRKDIAMLLGCCVKSVERNERNWGLTIARANTGTKQVMFCHRLAIEALRARNLLS